MERFGVVGQIRMGVGRRLTEAESSALFFAQRNFFKERERLFKERERLLKEAMSGDEASARKAFSWNLSLEELRDVFVMNPCLRGKVGERLMEMMDSPELVEEKIRQWLLLEPERIANALL